MAGVSVAALRWRILRQALLSDPGTSSKDDEAAKISRVPSGSFGFVQSRCVEDDKESESVVWEYILPGKLTPLLLRQARMGRFKLEDYSSSRRLGVDNTGVVCLWPAEEVLTFYCLSHPELFRNKRVIELGAGYGLAGLALAAGTDASEVLITDGNPKVVDNIQENITMNRNLFGKTKVRSSVLYWGKELDVIGFNFDIIIAADCTYFKDFHEELACTLRSILTTTDNSQAMLFCPARGGSLDLFAKVAQAAGLTFALKERYDEAIWKVHSKLLLDQGNIQWPNYNQDHNYPHLLVLVCNTTPSDSSKDLC